MRWSPIIQFGLISPPLADARPSQRADDGRWLPIRERSVGSGETRAVARDRRIFRERRFVEFDSQSGLSRRQHESVFEGDLHGEQIRENFARNAGTLLNGEVARGEVEVQARRG